MMFVCPSCGASFRVPPAKIPEQRVRYTCKKCGVPSVFQDHLREDFPDVSPTDGVSSAPPQQEVGTVYHHVGAVVREEMPPAQFEICCAVRSQDGTVEKCSFPRDRITLGRGDAADLRLDDPLASRVHAELERVKDRVVVKDLNSTNGTHVNEQPVAVKVLDAADVVRVGNTWIKVALRVR